MVPEKRPPFFGMAGVAYIIDGKIHEHLVPLPAMRIVAGSAADLHVAKLGAKQVGGALKESLSLLNMAAETSFLDREVSQHLLGQLGVYDLGRFTLRRVSQISQHSVQQLRMMNIVTRQTAHIASVVLPAFPAEMGAILRVALQARFIGLRSRPLAWITHVPAATSFSARFSVLLAVRVAGFTLSATRIF